VRVLLLPLFLLAGCITPPAVSAAGGSDVFLRLMPPGAERVAVPVDGDVKVRGVFVPGEPGAPVVVHLLGSGASVSLSYAPALFWEMYDRGLASLALDYRGVGPSEGSRSPKHLRGDAHAAFAEAVRRAGAPGRVVVRGTSIGTLAATALLEDGKKPAAVVLFAPVRGETVAKNWLYHNWWDVFAFPMSLLLRSTTDVRLVPALEACDVPLLVFFPERDMFVPPDEMALVDAAVRAAGGTAVHVDGATHLGVAGRGFGLPAEESALYARLFPGIPDVAARVAEALRGVPADALGEAERAGLEALVARRRFHPPALAAALALTGETLDDAERERYLLRWLRGMPQDALEGLPFDALVALVDFEDPLGALDPRELDAMGRMVRETFQQRTPTPAGIVRMARGGGWDGMSIYEEPLPPGLEGLAFFATSTRLVDKADGGALPADAPARLRLPSEESLRQAVRLMLKAAGIPERMAPLGQLEAYVEGGWQAVTLAPEVP